MVEQLVVVITTSAFDATLAFYGLSREEVIGNEPGRTLARDERAGAEGQPGGHRQLLDHDVVAVMEVGAVAVERADHDEESRQRKPEAEEDAPPMTDATRAASASAVAVLRFRSCSRRVMMRSLSTRFLAQPREMRLTLIDINEMRPQRGGRESGGKPRWARRYFFFLMSALILACSSEQFGSVVKKIARLSLP